MAERKPRVLLLTHSYTPELSPPQRRWESFVYAMRRDDWSIIVVTPRVSAPERNRTRSLNTFSSEIGLHGEVIRSFPSIKKQFGIASKLLKHSLDGLLMVPCAIFGAKPDVVVVTVPALPTLFTGYVVSRILRRPLIVEMRDAWPALISDSRILKWDWLSQLAQKAITYVQCSASAVVTVTDGVAQALLDAGVRRMAVIHNGISTRNYQELEPAVIKTGSLRILYLGNLGESQKLDSVLMAARISNKSVEMRIVGDGTAKNKLRDYARTNNIKVDFCNSVRGAAVKEHYEWADTCIVSLRDDWKSFEHTVPSKIYELLSLSKHITGLVTGEAARVIKRVNGGHIVDHDPIRIAELWAELSSRPDLLNVGSLGKEWVFENASLEKNGEKFMDLILDILKKE